MARALARSAAERSIITSCSRCLSVLRSSRRTPRAARRVKIRSSAQLQSAAAAAAASAVSQLASASGTAAPAAHRRASDAGRGRARAAAAAAAGGHHPRPPGECQGQGVPRQCPVERPLAAAWAGGQGHAVLPVQGQPAHSHPHPYLTHSGVYLRGCRCVQRLTGRPTGGTATERVTVSARIFSAAISQMRRCEGRWRIRWQASSAGE